MSIAPSHSLFDISALPAISISQATGPIRAREYQIEMIDGGAHGIGVKAAIAQGHRGILVQAATGLGKGFGIGMVAGLFTGKVMVLQHREELLYQNQRHVRSATGEHATIEKAEFSASSHSRVVVSSVQTQVAKNKKTGEKRMQRFSPLDFDALIIDEAHRAMSPSYRATIKHYTDGNPKLILIGFTATPNRHDGQAMGKIFTVVAFRFPINEAIEEGWLCPLHAHPVSVAALDLSKVRTRGDDFNESDLAAVMEFEKVLHELATPTIEISCGLSRGFLQQLLDQHKDDLSLASLALSARLGACHRRQTLVFCASVAHAERLAEILNRWIDGSAAFVCGETDKDDRKNIFADFGSRRKQFLCNVGIATEGTDIPGVEIIVMGKPTKSRPLFEQMAGRGTRPHDSIARIIGDLPEPSQRRQLIADSPKPYCEILDLVGNTGKHKLVMLSDLLGGDYSEKVRDAASKKAKDQVEKSGVPADVIELLKLAQNELDDAESEKKLAEEKEKKSRQGIRAAVVYDISDVNLFDVYDVKRPRDRFYKLPPATPGQIAALARYNLNFEADKLSRGDAGRLLGELKGRATPKQLKCLVGKNKYSVNEVSKLTIDQASRLIDRLANNGWKRPGITFAEPAASIAPSELEGVIA